MTTQSYTKGFETKRAFVMLTYKKLLTQNASSLTVRQLGAELGYSSAAIYRHFGSLEELITIASVHFLHPYMQEYAALLDEESDLIEIYRKGWRLFNKHAFERPDIFYGLFWGSYQELCSDAIADYYELFPFSGSERFPAYYYTIMFTSSIYEKDYQVLHRAMNHGVISEEGVQYLSRISPMVAKGLLQECQNQSPEERERCRRLCDELIEQGIAYVLKSDQT